MKTKHLIQDVDVDSFAKLFAKNYQKDYEKFKKDTESLHHVPYQRLHRMID